LSFAAGILVLQLLGADSVVPVESAQPALLTGADFERALEGIGPSASWSNVDLRRILREYSKHSKVAVLVDRRIDPTAVRSIDFANVTVREALAAIAEQNGAATCVVRNMVVIGPAGKLAKLRTLIQLRLDEVFGRNAKVPEGRRLELGKSLTLEYPDLQTPAELLDTIAGRYGLDVKGRELVPHDLWAGAILPETDAATALSLVLNQFDLTFQWTPGAQGVAIVPIPDVVQIERTYVPRGTSAEVAVKTWTEENPGMETEVQGKRIVVRATIEQHEAIAARLKPNANRAKKSATPSKTSSLKNRNFTLTVRRIPAEAVMKRLEKEGIEFVYDAKDLSSAGVDLKSPISISIVEASADELFHAIFDPLKLSFTVEMSTVTLKPQ
jgi:hypothetical protein